MDGSVARTSRKREGLKDYRKVSKTGEKGKMLERKKEENTAERQINCLKARYRHIPKANLN